MFYPPKGAYPVGIKFVSSRGRWSIERVHVDLTIILSPEGSCRGYPAGVKLFLLKKYLD